MSNCLQSTLHSETKPWRLLVIESSNILRTREVLGRSRILYRCFSFRNAKRAAIGSLPHKIRTDSFLVFWARPRQRLRIKSCKRSNFFNIGFEYERICAPYSSTGLTSSWYRSSPVLGLSPSFWAPNQRVTWDLAWAFLYT